MTRTLRQLFSWCAVLAALCACDAGGDEPSPAQSASGGAGGSSASAAATGGVGGAAGSGGTSGSPSAGSGGNASGGVPGSINAGTGGSPMVVADAGNIVDAAGADASAPGAACDRACLTEFNDAYLAALIAHDATQLTLADSVRFTENGKDLALNQGLWAVAKTLRAFRQDFAEVAAGQTAGFAALDDDDGVVLLAFRLKVVARAVTEIETIVVRSGESLFFAPESLDMRDPLYDTEVPAAARLPRAQMIEVVDAYFKGIESGDGSAIAVDDGAERNENGTVTASGSGIQNLAMFSYIEQVKRRYVLVDEERGNVPAFVLFEIPNGLGGSRTLHMVELFKVADGKIMDILAIMVNQPLGTPSGWE